MRRALLLVLWPRVASGACTTEKKYQLGTTSATSGGRCRKRDRDGEGSCKGDSGSWDADTRCCLAIGETPSCLGGTTYEKWNSWWGWYGVYYVQWIEYGCYKNVETCPAPAQICNPPEAQRSYSSCWQDASKGTGLCQSTLHGNEAWLRREGDTNPWVFIDLLSDVSIGGAYFQGRDVEYDAAGNGPLYQWTTSVQIKFRLDGSASGSDWTTVDTFSSNTDRSSVVHVTFTPRTARYWLIKPKEYSQYPCLRVALSGEGPGCGGVAAAAPGGGGGGGGGDNGGAIAGIVIGVVVGLCCCLAAVLAAVRYRRRAAEREGGTVAPAPPADLEMTNEKGQGPPVMQVETVPPVTAPPQIVQPQPGPPMLVQAQILAPGAPVPVHLPVAELMPAASGFCAKCRAPLAAGAAFCGRCGQAV